MKEREPFDLARTPLVNGATLIEASAGTGKTFTIAGLFLRLLLERGWSVREILVVTFTEAATEELRGRIRDRLTEAAVVLRSGNKAEDPFLSDVLRPYLSLPRPRDEALARLDRALCGFDETPIQTIHGFCQRTLRDRAFESGAFFDTVLQKDESRLFQEIADDFWRRQFYESASLPVEFLLKNRGQPEKFLPLLRVRARHPKLKVISGIEGRTAADLLDDLSAAFGHAREVWQRDEKTIRACLEPDSGWAKGEYAKPTVLAEHSAMLETCFDDGSRTAESLEAIAFFANSALVKNTHERGASPRHPFFDACDQVCVCERAYLTGLEIGFLDFALCELPRRKQRLKIQSFDDLLSRLRDALVGHGGAALAHEIRTRYRAALIDEFQDTDPVQYEIFRRIFTGRTARTDTLGAGVMECPSNGTVVESHLSTTPALQHSDASPPLLFLIGDPKQAIYGFRGADVFTYLDAARCVDQSHTLGQNFRSESGLVCAVNAVFSAVPRPFLFEDIVFEPVAACDHADQEPLREGGVCLPPLHLWFMPREEGSSEITKEKAEAILPGGVAAEIARLLNGDTRIGELKLSPRDIAVLVPENRHAGLMQEALRARNIPSVLYTEESVFATREARELERVLAAVARPADERLIRAALATDILGVDAPGLDEVEADEERWQRWREFFHQHHEVWLELGFMPMFRQLFQAGSVRRRLLRFADGERRLTNLLHLSEVLHQSAVERRLSPVSVVRWLAEQITSDKKAEEEHQLRLERDDQAVKLVTIHKSKGLEYPVVFCPFSWKSSDRPRSEREPVYFHERGGSVSGNPAPAGRATRFVCDLGSADLKKHRALAFEERLAENLRLLYVALTRARNRCYFVWGAFRGAATSAAAWLLHRRDAGSGSAVAERDAMTDRFKALDDATMLRDLQQLAARATTDGGRTAIQVQTLPSDDGPSYRPPSEETETPRARVFSGQIARDWRFFSFSALAAGRRDESPDYDSSAEPRESATESRAETDGIFAFPRGTQAGTCLHKVFENVDFTERDEYAIHALVSETLAEHGLASTSNLASVCETVRRTLAVPLISGHSLSSLSHVPKSDRLTEIEFCFPIRRLSPASLMTGFAGAGSRGDFLERLRRIDFQPAAGFVKGYIDLVVRLDERFYIVDWKSNWLGNQIEDYGATALEREMAAKLYPLQYHLYTVALHRHLALRLPGYDYEKHFGGVRYIFLRGVDPNHPQFGIFSDRPAAATIERLSAALSDVQAEDPR